jgi:hypothetical protein
MNNSLYSKPTSDRESKTENVQNNYSEEVKGYTVISKIPNQDWERW